MDMPTAKTISRACAAVTSFLCILNIVLPILIYIVLEPGNDDKKGVILPKRNSSSGVIEEAFEGACERVRAQALATMSARLATSQDADAIMMANIVGSLEQTCGNVEEASSLLNTPLPQPNVTTPEFSSGLPPEAAALPGFSLLQNITGQFAASREEFESAGLTQFAPTPFMPEFMLVCEACNISNWQDTLRLAASELECHSGGNTSNVTDYPKLGADWINGTITGDLYEGSGGRFLLVMLFLVCAYLLMYLVLLAWFSWFIGRERWWCGPYFTGLMISGNFGDCSLALQPFEKLCYRFGMHTEDPNLYFGPPHIKPVVRIPYDLAILGFRGRADDPWERSKEALTDYYNHPARVAFAEAPPDGAEAGADGADTGADATEPVNGAGLTVEVDGEVIELHPALTRGALFPHSSHSLPIQETSVTDKGSPDRGGAPESIVADGTMRTFLEEALDHLEYQQNAEGMSVDKVNDASWYKAPYQTDKGRLAPPAAPSMMITLRNVMGEAAHYRGQMFRSHFLAFLIGLGGIVQGVELTFGAPPTDPVMLPCRILVEWVIVGRTDWLDDNWMNEERPPMFGRVILLPFMYLLYAVAITIQSAGNVKGAGIGWLVVSTIFGVYCAYMSQTTITSYMSQLLSADTGSATAAYLDSIGGRIALQISLVSAVFHEIIALIYLQLLVNTLIAMYKTRTMGKMSLVQKKAQLQKSKSNLTERHVWSWYARTFVAMKNWMRKKCSLPPKTNLPVLLVVACFNSMLLNLVVGIAIIGWGSTLTGRAVALAREVEAVNSAMRSAMPEIEHRVREFQLEQCGGVKLLQFIVDTVMPIITVLIEPVATGVAIGLVVGGVVGVYATWMGVTDTIKTYGVLYDFFSKETPATLRFPVFRPDAARLVSSIVAYQLIGMAFTAVMFALGGATAALLWVDWPNASNLRQSTANTVANLMFYLLILAPIGVPLAQRYRSGPAIFVLEMYFLSTGLIKAWFRVVLIMIFSCQSFFFPAQNMFPDGYECWEPGHVVFCAYVAERIEQDRMRQQVKERFNYESRNRRRGGVGLQLPTSAAISEVVVEPTPTMATPA